MHKLSKSTTIGQKALGSTALEIYGMKAMNVALRLLSNLSLACHKRPSQCLTSQAAWKNAVE
jgi:hypothetical protein